MSNIKLCDKNTVVQAEISKGRIFAMLFLYFSRTIDSSSLNFVDNELLSDSVVQRTGFSSG